MARFACVMLLCLAAGGWPHAARAEIPLLLVRTDGVTVHFEVEVARTIRARQQGLMHRRRLSARSGMWFDFQRDTAISMWMKDTHVALDMLFFTDDGELLGVHRNARPLDETRIHAPAPARFVLEINAGEASRFALQRGARAVLNTPALRPGP